VEGRHSTGAVPQKTAEPVETYLEKEVKGIREPRALA